MLYKYFLIQVSILLVLVSITGCKTRNSKAVQPTFSSISKLIFSKKCALYTCHSSAFAKESGDLDLTDKSAYSKLVNVKSKTHPTILRIKPGDPENSLVIRRLTVTTIVAPPLERSSVSEEEIKIISLWIKNGALNN